MDLQCDRRTALAMLAGGGAALGDMGTGWAALSSASHPMLATPEQMAAERHMLAIRQDASLIALQAAIKADLLAGTIGRTRDGAATVDRAIDQWTNSLILAEIGKYRTRPEFIWGTDDTPRRWYGREFAVGTSGDNPDAIYRSAILDGSRSYEMTGRLDPATRAAQLVIEVDAADLTSPGSMMEMHDGQLVMQNVTLKILIDDRMDVGSDGSFRVTLNGQDGFGNHVKLKPGAISLSTRDILSDWNQRPARLSVREVNPLPRPAFPPLGDAAMRAQVLADLPGFIKFWSHFPEVWFGGLAPNAHSAPMGRVGGWGFVAGLRYDLQPGEAMIVTTTRGAARYTGFQLNDPWMIQPDARKAQVCLNNSQTVWNRDGSATYVIAAKDPGAANWLDPAGTHSGLGVMRWQAVPPAMTKDGLIRDVRVVKLAEVAAMDLPLVTPAERRRNIAMRGWDYASRTR